MSLSTVSFLIQVNSGKPVEYFRSTYDLNGLTLEVIDTFYLWFLFNHFSYMLFIISSFVFLYSGLVVAFQPCME